MRTRGHQRSIRMRDEIHHSGDVVELLGRVRARRVRQRFAAIAREVMSKLALGLDPRELPSSMRGMARRKAQTYGSAISRIAAGASRRATCASRSDLPPPAEAVAHAICGVGRRQAALSVAGYGRAVSQLLAGTRSGPGRSPCRRPSAHAACLDPRAPHPVPQHEHLMMRPSVGRGERDSTRSFGAGDKTRSAAATLAPEFPTV
jgi:hypothetical protein